jgi:putative hemolysin
VTQALVILLAVLAGAVLTAGATAVRSVNRLWLRSWIERDDAPDAEPTPRFVERPKRLLLSAGTALTFVAFLAGAALVRADAGDVRALARDAAILTVAMVAFGQLLPRAIARRWAPRLIPVVVPPLRLVAAVVAPIRDLARRLARRVARLIAPRSSARSEHTPAPGLADLLQDGSLEGLGAAEEIAIIERVLALGSRTAGEVMTPRDRIFALPDALEPTAFARAMATAAYSRVPVYRGDLDHVLGMVHVFDVFLGGGDTRPPLRPVAETRDARSAADLLLEMLRARRQLAVVRDASGRVAGIVTLEDLLEELVGDIDDEHDDAPVVTAAPRAHDSRDSRDPRDT